MDHELKELLTNILEEQRSQRQEMAAIGERLDGVEKRLDETYEYARRTAIKMECEIEPKLQAALDGVLLNSERLDRMDQRMDQMDQRMDRMDKRMDRMDGRLDNVERTMYVIADTVGAHDTDIRELKTAK